MDASLIMIPDKNNQNRERINAGLIRNAFLLPDNYLSKRYLFFFTGETFVFLKKEILLQSDYYLTCELYKILIYFVVQ